MDALNPAKRRAAQRPTPQRVYVKVTSEFDATGYMQPRAITWADGRTFAIDAVRDFRRASDVPGYERIPLAEETRFIATMNYGYAGTRELNEALTSRFAVIQMPTITEENLEKLLRAQFADLTDKYVHQFALLFLDLQKKCDSAEISTKALDLRGMLDALRLMRRGVAAGPALDMGITNKAFDSYEQGLIRDVIAARIPASLTAEKLFR